MIVAVPVIALMLLAGLVFGFCQPGYDGH